MVPATLMRLDQLPTTVNGKLDVRALLERDSRCMPASSPGRSDGVPPAGGVEQALAAIWAELLEIDVARIRRHSDLFALGGHSLLLVRMTASIRSEFGVDLAYRQLFDALSLDAMAMRIRDAVADDGIEDMEEVQW
ncbi:hypothetical protein GCM10027066_00990 [Dyella jejuensis]